MRLARLLVSATAAAAAALAFASAGAAHDTPTAPYDAVLKAAHHNVLATSTAFGKGCDEWDGAVPAGKDGWVFNTPNDQWDQTIGAKVIFSTPGGDVTILIKTGSPDAGTYPQAFGPAANPHNAWVLVPQGWTLKDGEGKTIGAQTEFLVTHTCPGTPSSPSPDPSSPPPSNGESSSPGESPSTSPGGDLPRTGFPITGFVIAGVIMLAGGAALLAVRRRRDLSTEI